MKNNSFIMSLSEYFSTYLPETKGVSANTIKSYEYAFQLLFDFLNDKKNIPPDKVDFAVLANGGALEYLHWVETERNCSPSTRNLRRTALSAFAKYAMKKNLADAIAFYKEMNNIPRKKTQKDNDVKYFTKDEISILLKAPNTSTKTGKRDAVLLSFLYASGARAQELCDLTINDLHYGEFTNVRLNGKGKKPRVVTIPDNCVTLVANYLKSINLDTTNPSNSRKHVFSSQTNEQMSISCVEEIVGKYVAQAKTEYPHLFPRQKYSPHSFRHSIAVHMLECGESLVVIKAFLGHSSISSTVIYASVTPELANKYLKERGKLLPSIETEEQNRTNQVITALPFLSRMKNKN